ncbi:MAG: Trm112 family protein [Planctomycetota bacterium]|nr:Trm112 family protein [Planctomycetota bacterium]
MLDAKLLEILACPHCVTRPEAPPAGKRKGEFEWVGEAAAPTGLRCLQCGRVYKIEDGIPNLLIEEAVLPGGQA